MDQNFNTDQMFVTTWNAFLGDWPGETNIDLYTITFQVQDGVNLNDVNTVINFTGTAAEGLTLEVPLNVPVNFTPDTTPLSINLTNPSVTLSQFTPDLSIQNSPIDPTQIYLVSPNSQWGITNLTGNVNDTDLIDISYQINNGNPITINLNENGEFSQPLELTGLENSYPNLRITATYINGNTVIDSRNLGVILTTETGLGYLDIEVGNGVSPEPSLNDNVTVHYTGVLTNGTVFDSSRSRGVPSTFSINGVIAGFKEGLDNMQVGGRHILFIPSDLAYGSTGTGSIPPNSTLIFDVELLAVNFGVTPINRAPVLTAVAPISLVEGATGNVVTVVATDADGDPLTYSIVGGNTDVNNNGNLPFAINPETGAITVNDSDDLVFASQSSFVPTIQADDQKGGVSNTDITINLTEVVVNNPVQFLQTFGPFKINEKSANGVAIGKVTAMDADPNDRITYSIVAGNDDVDGDGRGAFSVNHIGLISVNDSDDLIYATQSEFKITIRASDGATFADTEVVIQLNAPPVPRANIFGGQGNNILDARNIETSEELPFNLFGGSGDDNLIAKGAAVSDVITTLGDRLFGGNGNDILDGSQGTGGNFLYGGSGDDTLIAGQGDLLVGSSGNDTFKFVNNSLGEKPAIVLDFDSLTDKIDLSELTVNNQPVTFAQLSFEPETAGIGLKVEGIAEPIAIFAALDAEDIDQENLYIF